MKKYFEILKNKKNSCFLKKETSTKYVSIAISESGNIYTCGKIESYNHLLDIPSELGALVYSGQQGDYKINTIITMVFSEDSKKIFVDPSIIKLLIDHSKRTGTKIEYIFVNDNEEIIFQIKDVEKAFDYYNSEVDLLAKVEHSNIESNKIKIDNYNNLNKTEIINLLKKYSSIGIGKNFPTSSKSIRDPTRPPSGYGAAIITENGNLYYSGQYSTPDHRYGVHAEPGVFISALVNNDINIEYLGLSSSKHIDDACELCGCCRQFYSEIEQRTGVSAEYFTFSGDGKIMHEYSDISQLLPGIWSSKI